ncbi:hypothetical protein [uncultured Algimonas sp.]|uniref:hypothetical protein n=1 Tax=uncultured Algimonas sp. TaxID=1547920 RepID=UPI002620D082|nr:hypothetical protein [uncultured Algimonas sp.]
MAPDPVKDIPYLLEKAAAKGFAHHFETQAKALYCRETDTAYGLGAIRVEDMWFVDAGTDPGSEATLYLLEAEDGTRGVLLIGNPANLSAPERALLDQLKPESKSDN